MIHDDGQHVEGLEFESWMHGTQFRQVQAQLCRGGSGKTDGSKLWRTDAECRISTGNILAALGSSIDRRRPDKCSCALALDFAM
jgi:hypothetical protein